MPISVSERPVWVPEVSRGYEQKQRVRKPLIDLFGGTSAVTRYSDLRGLLTVLKHPTPPPQKRKSVPVAEGSMPASFLPGNVARRLPKSKAQEPLQTMVLRAVLYDSVVPIAGHFPDLAAYLPRPGAMSVDQAMSALSYTHNLHNSPSSSESVSTQDLSYALEMYGKINRSLAYIQRGNPKLKDFRHAEQMMREAVTLAAQRHLEIWPGVYNLVMGAVKDSKDQSLKKFSSAAVLADLLGNHDAANTIREMLTR